MTGLDDLIDRIVLFQRPVDLRNRIMSLPATSRPRVFLSSREDDLPSDDSDPDVETLKTALRYLFILYNPVEAISKCCDLTTLIALHQSCLGTDQAHTGFDSRTGEVEAIAHSLLEIFRVPHLDEIGNVYSVGKVLSRIEAIEHVLQRGHERSSIDLVWWQGSAINTWSLVEAVLKFSLGFFALHFDELLPNSIFRPLQSGGPVSAIVRVLEDVEYYFQNGELRGEAKKRERERAAALTRISERHDLTSLDKKQQKNTLLQKHKDEQLEIDRRNESIRERLQNRCWNSFGRITPFGTINAQEYQKLATLHRNRFAHKPIEELLGESQDSGLVRDSIQRAKEIVQDLGQARVVPRVIVILGQGYDNFGNRMIWFGDRDTAPIRNELEWLYLTSPVKYEPFQHLAMLAPNFGKGRPEPLIDPVMYPIDEVREFLNAR